METLWQKITNLYLTFGIVYRRIVDSNNGIDQPLSLSELILTLLRRLRDRFIEYLKRER